MSLKTLVGSNSERKKIRIRIRNKSFRIRKLAINQSICPFIGLPFFSYYQIKPFFYPILSILYTFFYPFTFLSSFTSFHLATFLTLYYSFHPSTFLSSFTSFHLATFLTLYYSFHPSTFLHFYIYIQPLKITRIRPDRNHITALNTNAKFFISITIIIFPSPIINIL